MSIEIRTLYELREMYPAVELQKVYWGSDVESVVAAQMLFSIARSGGHILAAFDGEKMVGVLIGLFATTAAQGQPITPETLSIASKRMVVLPEYRSRGIGNRLKWTQREIALSQGIRRVTWTFDPLLAANAYLNIHKLGCTSCVYFVNYYGIDERSGLAVLGSSDRLQADWLLESPRVLARLDSPGRAQVAARYLKETGALLSLHRHPAGLDTMVEASLTQPYVLMPVPLDYPSLVRQDPQAALQWRRNTRQVFQSLFAHRYTVREFVRDTLDEVEWGIYVFEIDAVGG